MPTRVLLEGPAIEPLLAQVRQQYGASVRIISADKVRTGGLGGFFAKQRYELSVEVPDEPDAPAERAPADEPADSLAALLGRAEAQDGFAGGPAATRTADAATARHGAATARPDAAMARPDAAATGGLPARAGLVSTNGDAFAEVMAGFGSVGIEAPARSGAPAVRPFRPATAVGTPVNGSAPAPAPIALADLAPAVVEPIVDLPIEATPPAFAAPNSPGLPAAFGPPVNAASVLAAYAAATALPAAPAAPAVVPAPTVSPVSPAPAGLVPSVSPAPAVGPADPLVANLVELGLPERLAVRITGADAYGGILQALADLPAAPAAPNCAGEVLVIAGELAHALPVARRVVEHLRLDASRLLLAGPSAAGTGIHPARKISGPGQAERKARKIHRADTAYVVVLDAPVSGMNEDWVRDTCDALGATAVWAVVDATRKTADTRRHLRALGDVEAIAVHSAGETADPGSVLGLDLPIVAVDGQPATAHTWAALLCERLSQLQAAGVAAGRRRRRGR